MAVRVQLRQRDAVDDSGLPREMHPVLRRVLAARGVTSAEAAELRLARMLGPERLGGIAAASNLLADAIQAQRHIVVVGDYDADGATGTAVAVRGLRKLGATRVGYAVPNRFLHGYGLSAELVRDLLPRKPELIVTVDNGIASHAGVLEAASRGVPVLITDHHLPGPAIPPAAAIVNPNLPGDEFPSKALAGVGVMFYLLLAVRARLRDRAAFGPDRPEPDLAELLDLVALGTVADLVPLDANNRVLVAAGLKRIRAGLCCPGIAALAEAGKRELRRLSATDLAFALAPRINAAGRLEDMSVGIECLLADDPDRAHALAAQLDRINQERRELQSGMLEQAEALLGAFKRQVGTLPIGLSLLDRDWHAGVVGLVASKLKEQLNRPVVAFAPAAEGSDELRGSGRSVAGFHLRDALAAVDARHPGMILRFGGHAMAAGLSLRASSFARFADAFDLEARRILGDDVDSAILWSDGSLSGADASIELAEQLSVASPWGQGFTEPLFDNVFAVKNWRILGERHLRMDLAFDDTLVPVRAIYFNGYSGEPLPQRVHVAYHLNVDDWRGERRVQLMVRHLERA
jgi:single-stranded-DNA-specific exonuclease